MKVKLDYRAAEDYYWQKGLSMAHEVNASSFDEHYVLFARHDSKYCGQKSAIESLDLVIPSWVDYLAGGGFIDPLRKLPTYLSNNVALFTNRQLNALTGWAMLGRFRVVEKEMVNGKTTKAPVFELTKMGRARHLLVCSEWDREVLFSRDGLTEETLEKLLSKTMPNGGSGGLVYFDKLTDIYGLSGRDCFVITLDRKSPRMKRWLDVYREQKEKLIAESEVDWRYFRWRSGDYAHKILRILPTGWSLPENVSRIFLDNGKVIVEYVTGTRDVYRCDETGYQQCCKDYGVSRP